MVKKWQWCNGVLEMHAQCVCVCVSHIAVLLREQQDLDALHVGTSVQQVNCLVQIILTSQRDRQLPGYKRHNIYEQTNTKIHRHTKAFGNSSKHTNI